MGNTDSLNSQRPGLEGSHHLPPYSIFYVSPQYLHPNGFYSWDSQRGVSKLSWFGLAGLSKLITPGSYLWSGWGLKQTYSFPQKISNDVSHSTCAHRVRSIPDFLWSDVELPVWFLALLLTITCDANVWMAHARPFLTSTLQGLSNGIKNTSRWGVLTSTIELWNCKSPEGLQVPTFGSLSLILTLASKWGCEKNTHYANK